MQSYSSCTASATPIGSHLLSRCRRPFSVTSVPGRIAPGCHPRTAVITPPTLIQKKPPTPAPLTCGWVAPPKTARNGPVGTAPPQARWVAVGEALALVAGRVGSAGSEAGEVCRAWAAALGQVEAGGVGEPVQPAEGDPVPVEELADHQPPAWCQHPCRLAQYPIRLGDLAERGHGVYGVECPVGVGQFTCVRAGGPDRRQAVALGAAHHVVEHLLLDVEHIEPSLRPELRGDVQRLQARPRADLQDPLPGRGCSTASIRSAVRNGNGASRRPRWAYG